VAKTIRTELHCEKNFLLDGQTSQAKFSSQPVNLLGARCLAHVTSVDGMSAKIGQLSTEMKIECQPRCCSSVDRVLGIDQGSIEGIHLGYRSTLDHRCLWYKSSSQSMSPILWKQLLAFIAVNQATKTHQKNCLSWEK